MTRQELITSDEFISAHIEVIVVSHKPVFKMRQELNDFIIKLRNELYASQMSAAAQGDGWVKVEDGLPEVEVNAIDIDDNQWIGTLWKNEAGIVVCEFANPNGSSVTIKVYEISHWRYLPAPPIQ